MFIYTDESGNLSGPKRERYFVLAALLVKDERIPKRITRRAKKRGLPKKLRHLPEIKGGAFSYRYRELLFKYLMAEDVHIGLLVVDTHRIPKHLRKEEGLFYLRLSEVLLERCGAGNYDHLDITFDRRDLKGITRVGFNTTLKERFSLAPRPKRFSVQHNDSTEVAGLRLAHHIAWAAYQKYQRGDPRWCKMLSPKIISEESFDLSPLKTKPHTSPWG